MKRFVTYLYEYERGKKSKNIGFIRVNIRNEKTELQFVIRNCMRTNGMGKIFVLINKKKLLGIELGEIQIRDGQSDGHMIVSTNNIMDSGNSVNEIVGVGIRLQDSGYFASCWKDEFAEEVARGEFSVTPEILLSVAEEHELENQIWNGQEDERNNDQANTNEVTYRKIDISQLRDLPSPNWHLSTNSFLVHGFANYGYLVLKKEMEADKEKLSLGVPGIFEKPEAVMAILFGFPEFEAFPSEMVAEEMSVERRFLFKEKNQEPRVGLFGCWFVDLKK